MAAVLAKPKSRIFSVQSDFTTILLGFRSYRERERERERGKGER